MQRFPTQQENAPSTYAITEFSADGRYARLRKVARARDATRREFTAAAYYYYNLRVKGTFLPFDFVSETSYICDVCLFQRKPSENGETDDIRSRSTVNNKTRGLWINKTRRTSCESERRNDIGRSKFPEYRRAIISIERCVSELPLLL